MTGTPDFLRVAILDSNPQFIEGFSEFIVANAPQFQIVVVSATWAELVESENFPARVVFLDADAQETVSLQARIRACRATGAVVVATTASGEGTVDWQRTRVIVEAAGAKGFVSKLASFSDFVELIDRASEMVFSAFTDDDWRPLPGTTPTAVSDAVSAAPPRLSRGESEALALYASGKTVAEVGSAMNVQYETAKTFLRRVREKYALLGRPASNRADLTSRATEDGFLT